MTDYKSVTLREANPITGHRLVQADDNVSLRKAVDPRKLGEGVEIITKDPLGSEKTEFISLERIASIVYAPVAGKVAVAETAPGVAKAGK